MVTQSSIKLPVRPTTIEELAATIGAALKEGQVRVVGSDSMPLLKMDEARPVQTISTLRMNKVLEHAISDMTVVVQAGISLEALQRELAWREQWLPVDPWAVGGRLPGQRTIGGMIATNALGPLRWSAGDWRLFVMGMKWVDAQGEVISGGGRTVKNVAGYSTPRMMIGSGGSLGVIAEVTLRTFARPRDEQCVLFFCRDALGAEALLAEIFTAPISAAYLQVVSGATFRGNPLQLPTTRTGVVVIAGFMDRPAVCAAQIEVVRGLAAARGLESIAQTAAQAGRLRLWMTSEPALGEGMRFCVHGLSSQVCGLVSEIAALDREKVWVVSEAGMGVVRGTIARADGAKSLAAIVGHHAGAVADIFSATAAQSSANASWDIGGRLKTALDPRGLFGRLRSA